MSEDYIKQIEQSFLNYNSDSEEDDIIDNKLESKKLIIEKKI